MVVENGEANPPAIQGLAYDNSYCWILRIEGHEIKEGTIYSDTELVTESARAGRGTRQVKEFASLENDRIDCALAGLCSGCGWIGRSYVEQLAIKPRRCALFG